MGEELVNTIRWRPARPEAGTLPFPSGIISLDWHSEPHVVEGLGEVYGEERPFVWLDPLEHTPTPHICGTEADHLMGSEYRPDLPPVTFRADGLPTCCGPIPPEPPPDPVPGPVCAEAMTIDVAQEVTETHPGGLDYHWFVCPDLDAPGTYHVEGSAADPFRTIELRIGATCADAFTFYFGNMNFLHAIIVNFNPLYDKIFVAVGHPFNPQPAGEYTFKVLPGA